MCAPGNNDESDRTLGASLSLSPTLPCLLASSVKLAASATSLSLLQGQEEVLSSRDRHDKNNDNKQEQPKLYSFFPPQKETAALDGCASEPVLRATRSSEACRVSS
jgi:hypothetical protein